MTDVTRRVMTAAPGIDLVAPKLHPPMIRSGTVPRPTLIERLARDDTRPIVSVVAPAGYGKTTLLTQWAEDKGRAFAWVSVEEPDNDPKILLTYVATALDAVEPIDERVFDALASPGSSVPGSVVPRLGSALSSMSSPVTLVLDDVHVLHDRECRAALSVLADHVPGGSRLVLAGRAEPPLRMARLRAEGKVTEIGAGDLAMTRDDAAALLRAVGVVLSEDEVAALYRQAEGWPAGLYLAALYLREGGLLADALSFSGADRLVSEYVEAELLERISARQRVFLTRTAVLTRICGPLCEAVLDQPQAAATLADVARSNLLLVPLDRYGEWYRYHQLFRDMLLAELHRRDPGLIPVLLRRAAEWHERAGTPVAALEYWMEAGDADAAARLAGALAVAAYQQGKIATVERWFGWLEGHQAMEKHPGLAVLAALLSGLTGKPADAERWVRLAEQRAGLVPRLPDGSSSIEPWLALLRALLCRNGVAQMQADAELAVTTMAAGSFLQIASAVFLAIAHLMTGDPDRADAIFADAAATGKARGIKVGVCVALGERSLLAANAGAWEHARSHLSEARAVAREAHLEDHPPVTILYAVAARLALQEGDRSRARVELTRAQRLRPALTYALPHLAVQARIELARCHLALSDYAAARVLLREVDEILRLRPGLGVFTAQAEALRAELARVRSSPAPQASALSAAELRVLPMLSTHLSFPEIGAQMFLSRYTVKAQATSVYRKLGVCSRRQAVARARELGLLDE
jgi:LuxR family transcriptional regulator, maltose regulon positive regulatory protein